MGISIPLPDSTTGRAALRVFMFFLPEAALVAMMRDLPLALQMASVVCPLTAAVFLELQMRYEGRAKVICSVVIYFIAAIYLGFIVTAADRAVRRYYADQELTKIYYSMGPHFKTAAMLNDSQKRDAEYASAVAQYKRDYEEWEKQTADWMESNLGPAAEAKLLDLTNMQFHCWGPPNICRDVQVSETFERFLNANRNLQVIMQSRGVTF